MDSHLYSRSRTSYLPPPPPPSQGSVYPTSNSIQYMPEEPPIDYTLRDKPKIRPRLTQTPSFDNQTPTTRRIQHGQLIQQQSIDRIKPAPKPRLPRQESVKYAPSYPSQDIQQILSQNRVIRQPTRLAQRRNTIQESEIVLGELDTALEEEELMAMEEPPPLMVPNTSLQYYAEPSELSFESERDFRSISSTSSIEAVRQLVMERHSSTLIPMMNQFMKQHRQSLAKGVDKAYLQEEKKKALYQVYAETEQMLDDANREFTPSYFLYKDKFSDRDKPTWKKELIAKKKSAETLREIEENAWAEFGRWKKEFAPDIRISQPIRR